MHQLTNKKNYRCVSLLKGNECYVKHQIGYSVKHSTMDIFTVQEFSRFKIYLTITISWETGIFPKWYHHNR